MDTLLVNKAIICGIVMRLPQFDYMPDGTLISRIIVTTTEHWTEHDEYDCRDVKYHETHELLAYGRLAEIVATQVKEWSKIYAEGVMRDMHVIYDFDAFRQDPRTKVVLIATDLQFLGYIPNPPLDRTFEPMNATKLPDYCYQRSGIPACVWNDADDRPTSREIRQSLDDEFSVFVSSF